MNHTKTITNMTYKLPQWFCAAYTWLLPLSQIYPSFTKWYYNQVIPGVERGNWSLIIEIRDGKTAAIAILKHAPEKRLCTLRVGEEFRGYGLGSDLFEKCLRLLGTDKPLCSVSEVNMDKYEKIFNRFGFEYTRTYSGLYIKEYKEFSFNGCIRPIMIVQGDK